ncbi:MAG: hypothetical protein A2X94_14860 [Bdellovibrionales bacterium GWB1_55_8]|nr:MAG: hypothetical protein A2X94_14860 [Bdellovibrionales bacterium GWB1_55_8]
MTKRFLEKTVLITGASSGIGAALARELATQGAALTLCGRRLDRLQELKREFDAQNRRCIIRQCDVNKTSELEEAVNATVKEFGKLDVLVANAGFGVVGNFETLEIEDYRRQFETNVFGLLATAKAGLSELKKSRGVLVLLGSVASYVSLPGNTAYAMSKFAVRAFAEGVTPELKSAGVSVVLISPGFVESEIRRVDNRGQLQAEAADPVNAWLQMPADRAARIIARAIAKRKREKIVTFHGIIAVLLKRHFRGVFFWLASRGLRSRREPG